MLPSTPPKTAAERQALRRQRRKREIADMREALIRISKESFDPDARNIAVRALFFGPMPPKL